MKASSIVVSRSTKALLIVLLLALVFFFVFNKNWHLNDSMAQFQSWLLHAPVEAVFVVLLLTPIVGVPLSILLIAVGLTMPLSLAISFTALTLLLHHFFVYLLSKTSVCTWLKAKLIARNLLLVSRKNNDAYDNLFFILAATWIPGVSYIFKLIYVAMADLPLRTYFIGSTLSQLIAALPYLVLGKVVGDGKLLWVGVLVFVITLIGWLIKKRVLRGKTPQLSR